MAVTTFAAIDVGSNEICIKIFEFAKKDQIRVLTHVRHIMELGSDTFANGYISAHMIDELCDVLKGFTMIMKDYGVKAYKAYCTSSVREAANRHFLLDRVRVRTGIDVTILSNSEQRFLLLQALALNEPDFNSIIKNGTIIVDVGSGSSQTTCFSDGNLINSQNIRLGSLRINEILRDPERTADSYTDLLKEYIAADISTTYRKYFNGYNIKSILAVGEGIRSLRQYINYCYPERDILTAKEMNHVYDSLFSLSISELAGIVENSDEQAKLILPTAMIYEQIMNINNAEKIIFNMTDLCDGIAYEYAVSNNRITPARNFDRDILSSCKKIAEKYLSNSDHTSYVEKIALKIFDGIDSLSGLGSRDRLLLQAAVQMHDCGTFVNFINIEKTSSRIILSSEIIGLSEKEKHIISGVVKYRTSNFPEFADMEGTETEEDYLKIAKLTAIYRLANALDASKRQKLSRIKVNFHNDTLTITGESFMDLSLETAFFEVEASFFKLIYGIVPILKQRRIAHV